LVFMGAGHGVGVTGLAADGWGLKVAAMTGKAPAGMG
jgi:hypothetical protein